MRNAIIAGAALASAGLSSAAEAACATSVSISNVDFAQTWDPLVSPAAKTLTFTATFNGYAASTKDVKLIFLDNDIGTLRLNTAGPRYSITDSGGVTYGFPSGSSVDTQPALNASTPLTKTFTVTIPANTSPVEDFVGGQTYTEAVKYTLQCIKSNGSIIDTNSLQAGPNISLTVPRLVSIVTASPQTLNFGSFTQSSMTLPVSVKSTSTINVDVATTKGSQMVLSGAVTPYPTNSTIPYTLTFGGVTVTPGTQLTNQTRAGVGGATRNLVLSLTGGVPSGKLAGSYSDTITLTLTPGS